MSSLFLSVREPPVSKGFMTAVQGTMGAVISHPHPLMGGDMRNPVVEILAESLFAGGLSTLRFNFRGVGMSEGVFDEGRGEQEDVLAAVTYLERQGIREIVLAGYSFGAWVNAGVILREEPASRRPRFAADQSVSFQLRAPPGKDRPHDMR